MIINKDGAVYTKLEFSAEDEIEKVVYDNFNLLFGDYSILLPKSKIVTSTGKGTIPDGIIIDFDNMEWYILEVERGIHGTWEHIAPQISRQITAMENPDTKVLIATNCVDEITKNRKFIDLLQEIDIKEINIHGTINNILKNAPVVALPIDFIPNDLKEWTKTVKVKVSVWLIEKYKDKNEDILFNIPDKDISVSTVESDTESNENDLTGDILTNVINAGLLKVGDELYFDYGQKGKPKKHFTGIVQKNGIEVNGEITSVSVSSLKLIQQVNPDRTTNNGWKSWKTKDGKLIYELYKKLYGKK